MSLQPISPTMSAPAFWEWYPHDGRRYELIEGTVVEMPQPTGKHAEITEFLNDKFRAQIQSQRLPLVSKQAVISLEVPPTADRDTIRIPDVCVLAQTQWQDLRFRSAAISLSDPPPLLVVEIVSTNWRDDYYKKFAEYEERGIPEYWIVDYLGLGGVRFIGSPKQPSLTICQLVEGEYQTQMFRNSESERQVEEGYIQSLIFPDLALTAAEVFLD